MANHRHMVVVDKQKKTAVATDVSIPTDSDIRGKENK